MEKLERWTPKSVCLDADTMNGATDYSSDNNNDKNHKWNKADLKTMQKLQY